MKANSILELIGNTPHVRINTLFRPDSAVWRKLEKYNPGASIKDRIALAMIVDAEIGNIEKLRSVIIRTYLRKYRNRPGNCRCRKNRLILVMPESMSPERRKIMALEPNSI
jgi:cysteine synthase A